MLVTEQAFQLRTFTVNSLQELNGFSNLGVPYTDDRPYSIALSSTTASNVSIITSEDVAFNAVSSINITSLLSTPRHIKLIVNVSALAGAVVTWPNAPDSLTVTTLSTGVYQISNIDGVSAWTIAKSPLITLPADYNGTWNIQMSLVYPNPANTANDLTITWYNNITVNNTPEISGVINNVNFDQYETTYIDSYPQIIDTYASAGTYTVELYPNVSTAVYSMTSNASLGGTGSFNSTTDKYTIQGNYHSVNNRLSSMIFTPELTYANDFIMNYKIINPSSFETVITQNFKIGKKFPTLIDVEASKYYDQNTTVTFDTSPFLSDDSAWSPAPTYTITVTPTPTSAINSMSTAGGTGGTSTFNSSSKVLTISGTRDQINSHLDNLSVVLNEYAIDTIELVYLITSPGGSPVSQYLYPNPTEISLINSINQFYVEDTTYYNLGAPKISHKNFGIAANTLPLTLTITPNTAISTNTISTFGTLGASTSYNSGTKEYRIIGNVAQINNEVGNIRVSPAVDYNNDFYFTYQLTSNSGNINISTTQNVFNVGVNTETVNETLPRSYASNTVSYLFDGSEIQIPEVIEGNPTYNIKLILANSVGRISSTSNFLYKNINDLSNWDWSTRKFEFSANVTATNDILKNLVFVPNANVSSSTTVEYIQSRNSTVQTDVSFDLIGSVSNVNTAPVTHSIYSTTNLTLTPYQLNYMQSNVVIVAGGGGGGAFYGGGGGAGGVITLTSVPLANVFGITGFTLSNVNKTITVGSGGSANGGVYGDDSTSGTNSSVGNYIAYGGGAGGNSSTPAKSGGSGGGAHYYSPGQIGYGIAGQGNNGTAGDSYYVRSGYGGSSKGAGYPGITGYKTITVYPGYTINVAAGGDGSNPTQPYPTGKSSDYAGSGGGGGGGGQSRTGGRNGIVVIRIY